MVLALDGALARCSAAILIDGALIASLVQDGARGHATVLPPMTDKLLRDTGLKAVELAGIAVTVGPGSFTGLRAALALAHGLALGAGCPVVGVTVGEALADAVPPGRPVWAAIDSQRGRVFLEINGPPAGFDLRALPMPAGPIAIAGDAAPAVACRLAARGADVMLTRARLPMPFHVARVGARRLRGELAPMVALPRYVDPPAVRLPAAPPRPQPA